MTLRTESIHQPVDILNLGVGGSVRQVERTEREGPITATSRTGKQRQSSRRRSRRQDGLQPLTDALTALLSDWLSAQDWFHGTGPLQLRHAGSIDLPSPQELPSTQLSLLILAVAEDGGASLQDSERKWQYISVPLAIYAVHTKPEPSTIIGNLPRTENFRIVVDGTKDRHFLAAWLNFIRSNEGGAHAQQNFKTRRPFHGDQIHHYILPSSRSDTSVLIQTDQQLLLKFYRYLVPGVRLDIELGLALDAAVDEEGQLVPETYGQVVAGWCQPKPVTGAVSVLRRYIPNTTSAWDMAVESVTQDHDFGDSAYEMGVELARAHRQLAEVATVAAASVTSLVQRIRNGYQCIAATVGYNYSGAVDALVDVLESLPQDDIKAMTVNLPQLIHGNFGLNKVLCANPYDEMHRHWYLLDFDGERLRSGQPRIEADYAERDLVCMLRSLSYAAAMTQPANYQWAGAVGQMFIAGYSEEIGVMVNTSSPMMAGMMLEQLFFEINEFLEQDPTSSKIEIPLSAARDLLKQLPSATQ